jgi:Tfp pilus assembly protein PilN
MIRVNLLKSEKKEVERKAYPTEGEGKETKKKGSTAGLLVLFVIVLVAALALFQKRALDRENVLRAQALDAQAALAPVIATLADVEQSKTILEKKVALIQSVRLQQALPLRILEEIGKCLPDWVWLGEATLRNRLLEIKGRALSNVQISDYMDALQKTGLFESVGLVSSQQRVMPSNTVVEFTLNANFPSVPEPTPEGGAAGRKRP